MGDIKRYEHDCHLNVCKFMGQAGEFDVYHHIRGMFIEIVLRYGNNKEDFILHNIWLDVKLEGY